MSDSVICIAFLASLPGAFSVGFLGTPGRAWYTWPGGEKNNLWELRDGSSQVLRPAPAPGARSPQRGRADLPAVRRASGCLSALWQGETRTARVVGGEPALHAPVCLPRGPAVPGNDHQASGDAASPDLGPGQEPGEAVHGGHPYQGPQGGAPGHRDRRGVDPQAPYLSDSGERPGRRAPDLVRRDRTLGRETRT